jgi:hypothetical protein
VPRRLERFCTKEFVRFLVNLGLGEDKFQGRLLNTVKFTKSGSYSPTAGTRLIKVYVTGGGGGGGGVVATGADQGAIGSGGGGAGTAISYIKISELTLPIGVTVGTGGIGGDGNQEPLSGVNSSFGTYLSASGGARAANGLTFNFGESRIVSNGGSGAGINGNFLNLRGQPGTPAFTFSTGYESGGGGSSYFSGGGDPIASGVSVPGQNGVLGGGGGGAFNVPNSSRNTGGKGGDGIVIVEEYA